MSNEIAKNGIFIPKEILELKDLTLDEKCLLALILEMDTNGKADRDDYTNELIAQRLGMCARSVCRHRASLDRKGYTITTGGQSLKRIIRLTDKLKVVRE